MNICKNLLSAFVLVLLIVSVGSAATYTWQGGHVSGPNSFTVKQNWNPNSPNGGPTAADIVVFGSSGNACNIPTGLTVTGLTMNGTDVVTLTGTMTVGTLTLTSGILNGGTFVVSTVVGGSATSFVNGGVTRNCAASSATQFPVGGLVTITPTSTLDVTVATAAGSPAGLVNNGDALTRSYTITNSGGFTADVAFTYFDADIPMTAGEGSWVAGTLSGGIWSPAGTSSTDAGLNTTTLTAYAFPDGASDWTLGEPSALPIGLTTFDGVVAANTVSLTWSTMTEQNNLGFYVERRIEGASVYQTVSGLIAGAGTSMEQQDYSYTDANVAQGTYYYRLKQMDQDGGTSYSQEVKIVVAGALGVAETRPTEYSLGQNYPNPFNPSTQIAFALPEQGIVTLKVFNLIGQEVASLVNGVQYQAGSFNAQLDASQLSSGVYYYRLSVDGLTKSFTSMKKMMLVK